MLQHTFCHISGVSPEAERRLWRAGIKSWELANVAGELPLTKHKAASIKREIEVSTTRLAKQDAEYFANCLPTSEHWRLFHEFSHSVAYLDIETTGLGGPGDYITTMALYDGDRIRHYIHGQNLQDFRDDIARYKLIVTYNGKTFDAPFIRSYLRVPLTQAHIDLRYVLASLGYKGGLKGCERQLGHDREELADVDGFFAVLLWQEYKQHHNLKALETLLAYNICDVVNLTTLMVLAYNRKLQSTPFAKNLELPPPQLPPIPFQADRATIEKIQRRFYG